MSQEQLAEAVGLTYQQIGKYELGINRMSVSRLYELSQVLNVPVTFFFDDSRVPRHRNEVPTSDIDPLQYRETAELIEAYYAIEHVGVRRRLLYLAKVLAYGWSGGESRSNEPQ